MILNSFEIESHNGLTEDIKAEIKEKTEQLDFSKVAAVKITVTINNNATLDVIHGIALTINESLDDNTLIYMSTEINNNYSVKEFKINLLASDDKNELDTESAINVL